MYHLLLQIKKTLLKNWLNEKFRGLKTQVNYDTTGVKKGLFTNGCKKTIRLVHIA